MSVVKVMMLEEPELFHKIHEYEIHNNSTIGRTDQCRKQVNRLRGLARTLFRQLISLFTLET